MSSSNQKRKASEVDEEKMFFIRIDTTQTKNKNYVEFPLALPQEVAPKGSEELWYGYDDKKFYPVALYDASGKKASQNTYKDIRLQISIDVYDESDDKTPVYSASTAAVAATTNNCFWFTTIKAYSAGLFRLTVHSPKHSHLVAPLVLSIPCVANSEIKEPVMSLTSYAFKSDKKSSGGTSSSSSAKVSQAATAAVEKTSSSSSTSSKPAAVAATPVALSAKLQGALSASAARKASVSLATPRSDGTAVSRIVRVDEADEDDDDEDGQVLPYPSQDVIDIPVKRVERPGITELQLHGSVLKLTLPPSLAAALLDDKSRVSALLSSTSKQVSKEEIAQRNKSILELTEKYSSPSVHDVLYKIEKETKTTILGGADVFRTLRLAFEAYFEKTVLYEVEKEAGLYGRKIEGLKAQKRCLSTGFGAIFLLRFLVFLAVGIDAATSSEPTADEGAQEDATDAHTQSSMSRRRTLTYKQVTGAASKLQEVVQYIVKDLDKSSHFLFQ